MDINTIENNSEMQEEQSKISFQNEMFEKILKIETLTCIIGLIVSEIQELPREFSTTEDIEKLEKLRCSLSYTFPSLEDEVEKAMKYVS